MLFKIPLNVENRKRQRISNGIAAGNLHSLFSSLSLSLTEKLSGIIFEGRIVFCFVLFWGQAVLVIELRAWGVQSKNSTTEPRPQPQNHFFSDKGRFI